VIYTCTLCGACDVTCKFSRDMEPLEILHELRNLAVKEGKGPLPGHMPAVAQGGGGRRMNTAPVRPEI